MEGFHASIVCDGEIVVGAYEPAVALDAAAAIGMGNFRDILFMTEATLVRISISQLVTHAMHPMSVDS